MATKTQEFNTPTSCLNKAKPHEPLFVLRAKDPHAAQTVRNWAVMSVGTHEPAKIEEAYKLADQMDDWRRKEYPPKEEVAPLGSNDAA